MIKGAELRAVRTYVLRVSQQELAERLGVSQRTVVNWEATRVPERSEYTVMGLLGDSFAAWRAATGDRTGEADGLAKQRRHEETSEWGGNGADVIAVPLDRIADEALIGELGRRLREARAVVHRFSAEPAIGAEIRQMARPSTVSDEIDVAQADDPGLALPYAADEPDHSIEDEKLGTEREP